MLVAGPDIDAAGGWDAAIALAEKQRLPVWASPATGGSRLGFPERHPNFVGVLPPAIGPISETLKAHDLVLVVGSSVFPYYPYIPGPLLAEGTQLVAITSDPGEAARAPMGDAIVGDVALALERLVELVPEADPRRARAAPRAGRSAGCRPARSPERLRGDGRPGRRLAATTASPWWRRRRRTLSLRNRLRISTPGQLLLLRQRRPGLRDRGRRSASSSPSPARPVVCVLGEGSAQYGITALWSAVAYKAPVTFLVLRNDEYMILKWFAMLEQVTGAPGLDLPGLDVAAVARGYGVPAQDVSPGARS